MNKKIGIAIMISIFVIISIFAIIIEVERKITQQELLEKQVSAQEVKDITPPQIILKGNKEMTLKQGEIYKEQGYTANDDIDGSIVSKVKISKKTISETEYRLIYEVTDSAGNQTIEERKVHIEPSKINTSNDKNANNIINGNTNSNQNINKNQSDKNTQTTKPNDKNINNNKNVNSNKNTVEKAETKNQNISNEKGVIYLTFDDGPTSSSTPKILDILKKHNVKATFFIINYNSNTEALVKREVAEGHSVGIHGYSHDYKKIYTSEEAYLENLNKMQAKIYQSTGVKPTITRFPGGSSNTISKFNPGIMTRLSKLVVKNGYTYYDWNVDSNDAGGARNAEAVYQNVTKNLSKKWRNVVLMHDFSGNKKTIEALDRVIEYGKKNGYVFKAITKDTKMMRHTINN